MLETYPSFRAWASEQSRVSRSDSESLATDESVERIVTSSKVVNRGYGAVYEASKVVDGTLTPARSWAGRIEQAYSVDGLSGRHHEWMKPFHALPRWQRLLIAGAGAAAGGSAYGMDW